MMLLTYHPISLTVLVLQLALSKIFFPKCRIIRFPFTLKKIGNITIGRGFSANSGLLMEALTERSNIQIGDNVFCNKNFHVGCIDSITISSDVLIGSNCIVTDHNHGIYFGDSQSAASEKQINKLLHGQPVYIGSNVWIGDMVVILPGVTIGENSIVGAHSVVTKSIPKNSIAVGVPARVIKKYNVDSKKWESVDVKL